MNDGPKGKKSANRSILTTVAIGVGTALGVARRRIRRIGAGRRSEGLPAEPPATQAPVGQADAVSESQLENRLKEMRLKPEKKRVTKRSRTSGDTKGAKPKRQPRAAKGSRQGTKARRKTGPAADIPGPD